MLRQNTDYLLKKVSAQIRGDKIPPKLQSSSNNDANDDLNDYLQSLNSNKKKLTSWDQEISDLSEEEKEIKHVQSSADRFLKKSTNLKTESNTDNTALAPSNNTQPNKYLKKSISVSNSIDHVTSSLTNLSTIKAADNVLATKADKSGIHFSTNSSTENLNKLNDIKNLKNMALINKLDLDDSDKSIINCLDLDDSDDLDEIEIDKPKKGILKSPATTNRINSPQKQLIMPIEAFAKKSEIFGNIHNIDDLIPIEDIPTIQNNEYDSDFESTARSMQTPRFQTKDDLDSSPRKSRKNSSVESTPRFSSRNNDVRKVSISSKREVFKSTNPRKGVTSRPVTPATSRSYLSVEIEEASELQTASSSIGNEKAKSNSNNSTIASTQLEVLNHQKKDKEKNVSRRDSSKSTNYSADFERTFEEETVASTSSSSSSATQSSTSSSSSSTIKIKKKSRKKSGKKSNVKNTSCQTINDLHQHWVFSSANMHAFTLPENSSSNNFFKNNMININPQSLKDLSMQSPAAEAFNDLMKQQLSMMKQYIAIQASLHAHLIQTFNNLSPHHYTTLDETKNYIKTNKPRVITYEEALKQVIKEAES